MSPSTRKNIDVQDPYSNQDDGSMSSKNKFSGFDERSRDMTKSAKTMMKRPLAS